jgi:hypothetical protein
VLADLGFQGCDKDTQDGIRELEIPYKRLADGVLTAEQQEYNFMLSRNRIIIENFFARLKGEFKIVKLPFQERIDTFEVVLEAAVWLTDFDISLRPLRSGELLPAAERQLEEG